MKTGKHIRMAVLGAMLVALGGALALAAETFAPDPVHSSALFKVRHFGVAYVRGVFTDISGAIVMDKKKPGASSVQISIGTASVDTNMKPRDEDLKSDHFLDVAKYPKMSFKSRKVARVKKDQYKVTGDFTLHGVTKTITVPVTLLGEGKDPRGNIRIGFESNFTIKRSDYGMKFMVPAVGDKVEISLVIEAVKKQ